MGSVWWLSWLLFCSFLHLPPHKNQATRGGVPMSTETSACPKPIPPRIFLKKFGVVKIWWALAPAVDLTPPLATDWPGYLLWPQFSLLCNRNSGEDSCRHYKARFKWSWSRRVILNMLELKERLLSLPKRKVTHGLHKNRSQGPGPPWQGRMAVLVICGHCTDTNRSNWKGKGLLMELSFRGFSPSSLGLCTSVKHHCHGSLCQSPRWS